MAEKTSRHDNGGGSRLDQAGIGFAAAGTVRWFIA